MPHVPLNRCENGRLLSHRRGFPYRNQGTRTLYWHRCLKLRGGAMGLEPLDNSALPGEAAGASAPHPWLRSYPPGLDWREPVQREPLFLALYRAVAEYSALPCLDFLGRTYSNAEVAGIGRASCRVRVSMDGSVSV